MSRYILLIDDDREDAELFSDALAELAMDTVLEHFDDGLKAIEKLAQFNVRIPDIIFLDINMPSIDGWECLRKIKNLAAFQRIPIIMYSTSNLEREGLIAQDLGATAFLTKPDNFSELKQRLSDLFVKIG